MTITNEHNASDSAQKIDVNKIFWWETKVYLRRESNLRPSRNAVEKIQEEEDLGEKSHEKWVSAIKDNNQLTSDQNITPRYGLFLTLL